MASSSKKLVNELVLHSPHLSHPTSPRIPSFVYGTAWKKDRTSELVYQALCSGFKGVDTAAQPRHYQEHLVGDGLRRAIRENKVKREDIYLQTKYTPIGGQDPKNLPYDPRTSIPTQVKTSIASSLHNFRLSDNDSVPENTYIDTLVLHSPLPTLSQTLEAWQTAESFVPTSIHNLGISNVSLPILEHLYEAATVKPAVVQNRFYDDTDHDVDLRRFCRERGIVYQSFWTLTGNPRLLKSQTVATLAVEVGVSPAEALYALVLSLEGIVVLDGTTSEEHMTPDLAVVTKMNAWAEKEETRWNELCSEFRAMIGEDD